MNLDFLCIQPFRDGNARVSRLLLLLQCYQPGFEVGRDVSLERVIEDNKERYYETLEQSSQGWHEGCHDPWPYVNYALYVVKTAYAEFYAEVKPSELLRRELKAAGVPWSPELAEESVQEDQRYAAACQVAAVPLQ
jgi:Fic family protein